MSAESVLLDEAAPLVPRRDRWRGVFCGARVRGGERAVRGIPELMGIVELPGVTDPGRVGSYPATVRAGGGYVWDEVLEYRVWCHPERSSPRERDGNDYFHAFAFYDDAAAFARATLGAEEPVALVLQKEYIEEPEPGHYRHVQEHRLTEWPVSFLQRPRRTPSTIPDFLAPDAPPNRLDILRGLT